MYRSRYRNRRKRISVSKILLVIAFVLAVSSIVYFFVDSGLPEKLWVAFDTIYTTDAPGPTTAASSQQDTSGNTDAYSPDATADPSTAENSSVSPSSADATADPSTAENSSASPSSADATADNPSSATETSTTASFTAPVQLPALHLSSNEVQPGDYIVIYAANISEAAVVTTDSELIGSYKPEFFDYMDGKVTIFAVSYFTTPGSYNLRIVVKENDTAVIDSTEKINVLKKDFPIHSFTVSKELLEKRSEEAVNHDVEYTGKAKSVTSPVPLWDGVFIMPCDGKVTSDFGLIRYINGTETGRHSGLDISAPSGTDVIAANSGRVNLAMTLTVTGETIIIDHGMKLFSSYCHLSSILVKEGEWVEKGQLIGKVGSTGFSTGPHLHWGISLFRTYLNPWLFFDKEPFDWLNTGE